MKTVLTPSLLAILTTGAAIAAPVILTVDVKHQAKGKVMRATVVARPESGDRQPVSVEVPVPGQIRLDLEPGVVWRVETTVPGYWSIPDLVVPRATADDQVSRLVLWPTGLVVGKLVVAAGEALPGTIAVRLMRIPGTTLADQPEGEAECQVSSGAFRCAIPLGRFDLRLRAPRFVSHFIWGANLQAPSPLDVGVLALRRGGSVVGWLSTTAGPASPTLSSVELSPVVAPAGLSAPERSRVAATGQVVRPNERGFFHITGLAPGTYALIARQDGFAPATTAPVVVIENAEAEIRGPIVLAPPTRLVVTVTPSRDHLGREWQIKLYRHGLDPIMLDEVEAPTREDEETWTKTGLSPGAYRLAILDGDGSAWVSHDLDLAKPLERIDLTIPFVTVEGRVTYGRDGVPAVLFFGGSRGTVSIKALSDASGKYRCFLPRAGAWNVTLAVADPPVSREYLDIAVPKPGPSGAAALDFRLPDTRIDGTVVDERGAPVRDASVTCSILSSRESAVRRRTDASGKFSFCGLPEGRVAVEAHSDTRSSDPLELETRESVTAPSVRLVLREVKRLSGLVLGPAGPVLGAAVTVMPFGRPTQGMQTSTGVDGRFEATMPAWADVANVFVMPVGLALTATQVRVAAETGQELLLRVESPGGSLRLKASSDRADPRTFVTFIVRDGVPVPFGILMRWLAMNRQQVSDPLLIPALAVGNYSVCAAPVASVVLIGAGIVPRDAACTAPVFVGPNSVIEVHVPSRGP